MDNIWGQLSGVQQTPVLWMLVLAWSVAIVAVFTPAWKVTRNLITVVHEGGHAITAILWGRRITGIKLHSNTSGVTVSSGKPYGLGMIFTAMAGYIAPAVLGLGIQYLVSVGRIFLGIVILAILLLGIFLSIRNFWGLVVVVPLLAGFYFLFQVSSTLQTTILLIMATFLIVASLKPIIELQVLRMRGEAEDSDADQLAKLTLIIPGSLWVFLFFLIALAGNIAAIWLQLSSFFS